VVLLVLTAVLLLAAGRLLGTGATAEHRGAP
jgi:hypothetical protein